MWNSHCGVLSKKLTGMKEIKKIRPIMSRKINPSWLRTDLDVKISRQGHWNSYYNCIPHVEKAKKRQETKTKLQKMKTKVSEIWDPWVAQLVKLQPLARYIIIKFFKTKNSLSKNTCYLRRNKYKDDFSLIVQSNDIKKIFGEHFQNIKRKESCDSERKGINHIHITDNF